MERLIQKYVRTWENRCYSGGIPDEAPDEIQEMVPSYKRIAIAILKNDHHLTSLGFNPPKSSYYHKLKAMELKEKKQQRIEEQSRLLEDLEKERDAIWRKIQDMTVCYEAAYMTEKKLTEISAKIKSCKNRISKYKEL